MNRSMASPYRHDVALKHHHADVAPWITTSTRLLSERRDPRPRTGRARGEEESSKLFGCGYVALGICAQFVREFDDDGIENAGGDLQKYELAQEQNKEDSE